jgi:hypothetical protein
MKHLDLIEGTKHLVWLRVGVALTVMGGLLILAAPKAPAMATSQTLRDTVELCGGRCAHETITFETGDLRIDRIDVVFLIDASGSMRDEIDTVQGQSVEIMDSLRALVPDSAFGVASFVDYNGFVDSRYGEQYGSEDDYPYRLEQDITEDTGEVRDALDRITLEYGNDEPEGYSRALWEMLDLNWRENSKRIVILFGDAFPHDRTFFDQDYGVDPGRDEIEGTEDDLVFVEVVQDLIAAKISIIGVNSGLDSDNAVTFFQYVAEETGGLYFPLLDASEIPDAVAQLIEEEISTIDLLTIRASEGYGDWIVSTPEAYTDVGSNTTVEFEVDICPVAGRATEGRHDFELILDGDGAVLETIPISIDYTRRCTTGPEVFIADSDGDNGSVCSEGPFWLSPDIINRQKDDDVYYHENPLRGQTNYLYAQVHNIGSEDARGVRITLYWANAGIGLRWPDDWHKIDSTTIDVLRGESAWTKGIAWDPPGSSGEGHFCILAIIESDDDPVTREGDVPCDNNIAQRNLQVLDVDAVEEGILSQVVKATIVGPPEDKKGIVDIVVAIPTAPEGTEVKVFMPDDLFERWQEAGEEVEGGRVKGDYILADAGEQETIIHNVPLGPDEEAEIELEIQAPVDRETEPFSITVVERVDGQDWGGMTYYYAPPSPTSPLEEAWQFIQGNLVIVGAALGCCGLLIIGVAVMTIGLMFMRRRP